MSNSTGCGLLAVLCCHLATENVMKLLFLAFGYVAARGRDLLCRAPQLVAVVVAVASVVFETVAKVVAAVVAAVLLLQLQHLLQELHL